MRHSLERQPCAASGSVEFGALVDSISRDAQSTCRKSPTGRMRAYVNSARQNPVGGKSRMPHHLGRMEKRGLDPQGEPGARRYPDIVSDRRRSGRDQGGRTRKCRPSSQVLRRRPRPRSPRIATHGNPDDRLIADTSRNTRRSGLRHPRRPAQPAARLPPGSCLVSRRDRLAITTAASQRPGGMTDGAAGSDQRRARNARKPSAARRRWRRRWHARSCPPAARGSTSTRSAVRNASGARLPAPRRSTSGTGRPPTAPRRSPGDPDMPLRG